MRKRTIATEFAIQVYSDGTIDWDLFDRYIWRRIHEGPERALAVERRARHGTSRRRAPR